MKGPKPKIALGIAAVVGILLLTSLVQEMNRRWQVQREVAALKQEVQVAERKVVELSQLNQYFRTDAFQERLARENLNYSAPGETVVLIPEEAEPVEVQSSAVTEKEIPPSIPMKWWRIFFVEDAPFEAFQ
ncbi:MAG: septum formation initiator family protein [Patescibacteria group bacterium]